MTNPINTMMNETIINAQYTPNQLTQMANAYAVPEMPFVMPNTVPVIATFHNANPLQPPQAMAYPMAVPEMTVPVPRPVDEAAIRAAMRAEIEAEVRAELEAELGMGRHSPPANAENILTVIRGISSAPMFITFITDMLAPHTGNDIVDVRTNLFDAAVKRTNENYEELMFAKFHPLFVSLAEFKMGEVQTDAMLHIISGYMRQGKSPLIILVTVFVLNMDMDVVLMVGPHKKEPVSSMMGYLTKYKIAAKFGAKAAGSKDTGRNARVLVASHQVKGDLDIALNFTETPNRKFVIFKDEAHMCPAERSASNSLSYRLFREESSQRFRIPVSATTVNFLSEYDIDRMQLPRHITPADVELFVTLDDFKQTGIINTGEVAAVDFGTTFHPLMKEFFNHENPTDYSWSMPGGARRNYNVGTAIICPSRFVNTDDGQMKGIETLVKHIIEQRKMNAAFNQDTVIICANSNREVKHLPKDNLTGAEDVVMDKKPDENLVQTTIAYFSRINPRTKFIIVGFTQLKAAFTCAKFTRGANSDYDVTYVPMYMALALKNIETNIDSHCQQMARASHDYGSGILRDRNDNIIDPCTYVHTGAGYLRDIQYYYKNAELAVRNCDVVHQDALEKLSNFSTGRGKRTVDCVLDAATEARYQEERRDAMERQARLRAYHDALAAFIRANPGRAFTHSELVQNVGAHGVHGISHFSAKCGTTYPDIVEQKRSRSDGGNIYYVRQ